MSLLSMSGGATGTGTVTLLAPVTNTNRTLTLPDETDTVAGIAATQTLTNKSIAATQLTGTIAVARLPAGSVLQVVQGTFSTQTSMTGATPVATGLTATITPTSATSKILITVYIPASNGTATANAYYSIYKNASNLIQLAYYQTSDTGSNPLVVPYNARYYDSPATTSATTYAIYATTASASTHTWAFGNLQCNITLMEIAA